MPSSPSPSPAFPFAFDPFGLLRLPLSGDVWQRMATSWFSPSSTVTNNYNGNPAIEERVTREVASYGRQLGWLSDIVLAMARDEALPKDSMQKLANAAAQIDKIKKEAKDSALEEARLALSKLATSSPETFRILVNETYRAMNRRRDESR
ncbi:MAG: hypothetical protein ABTQ34_08230 [Bdellovibrionales bacterium]